MFEINGQQYEIQPKSTHWKFKDIEGKRFGRLLVAIAGRLRRGWSPEKTMNTPSQPGGRGPKLKWNKISPNPPGSR